VLQAGNAVAFGDQYSVGQTLFAGAFGALGGGLTGKFTKANPAAVSTTEVFDEFIDPNAVQTVSGGGITQKVAGAAIDNIDYSAGFADDFVVSASRTYSNAYKIAESGGRHSGFLKNYINRPSDQIRKAIDSSESRT